MAEIYLHFLHFIQCDSIHTSTHPFSTILPISIGSEPNAVSKSLAKTASQSVHSSGWKFAGKQTDRQTHRQIHFSVDIPTPRFRRSAKIKIACTNLQLAVKETFDHFCQ